MTYSTPELLLVGAAQNLVLEHNLLSRAGAQPFECEQDNILGLSDSVETW